MSDPTSGAPGRRRDRPFVAACAAGKHAYCTCGTSLDFPLCDGSHRALRLSDGSGPTPIKIVLESPQTVAWCACGRSAARPFCDGSHARDP